jgi:branched-chain amino acid transport system ATP-binding protein
VSGPLLKLEGVHTHIGAYHVLHGVDLEVGHGSVTLLLGRNGAGKTTTLRTAMGLWPASAGRILFDGQDITRLSTPERVDLGIAYVPEDMGIFPALTTAENITLAARAATRERDLDSRRLDVIFGFFPALRRFWHVPAGLLSGGQKQMVAIARAMIEPRRLLLVDEPSKGLAPSIVNALASAFLELKAAGTTILLVEQNASFANQLGDAVSILDDGETAFTGTMGQFLANEQLQQDLLGLSLERRRTGGTVMEAG